MKAVVHFKVDPPGRAVGGVTWETPYSFLPGRTSWESDGETPLETASLCPPAARPGQTTKGATGTKSQLTLAGAANMMCGGGGGDVRIQHPSVPDVLRACLAHSGGTRALSRVWPCPEFDSPQRREPQPSLAFCSAIPHA